MSAEFDASKNKWGLHPLFSVKYNNWDELEKAISALDTAKAKGDAFEQFCYFYFLYHKNLFGIEEVWCDKIRNRAIPPEIRKQYRLEKKDYGIDGASRLAQGKLEAWQGKFRSDRSHAPYAELATFWAESEHTDSRRIIANSRSLPPQAVKKKSHQQTLVDQFLELEEDFFVALYLFAIDAKEPKPKKFSPLPHQARMINDVVKGLLVHDRGKLIAACGTGKTLAALWITENKDLNISRVLYLAPSIALVGQTLKQWTMHSSRQFSHIAVCSDQTVDADLDEENEFIDINRSELGVSVTTTPDELATWLKATNKGPQYIFSTYQSVEVIEEALKHLDGYKLDIIVFDEAHRTVGKGDQHFAVALDDARVSSRKRLFMTATEKLISPRIKTLVEQAGQVVFSMSDLEVYGPILHEYNFGMAIHEGVIADYEIVLAEVSGQEEQKIIDENRLMQLKQENDADVPLVLTADLLFKSAFLIKAIQTDEVSKAITFHNKRVNAKSFSRASLALLSGLDSLAKKVYVTYVLGTHNTSERAERITAFEKSQAGILSNVQVLSEGVDIPLIDSVYFVDPKTSLIEIVQAIGRALRKPLGGDGNKIARIIVPIRVPPDVKSLEDIDWDNSLQTFHSVIQSMRSQDKRLEDQVDEINLYAISGGKKGTRIGLTSGKIRIMMPAITLTKVVDVASFLEKINLRIAIANANPDGTSLGFSYLGKGERKSEYKPIFGILGDYNPQPFKESLIDPTLERFYGSDDTVDRRLLAVNHNNYSHTFRLGLIKEVGSGKVQLTTLGRLLKERKLSFEQVFINQMLLFSPRPNLFPYRIVLRMLLEVGELNHIEFLYGPYVLKPNENDGYDVSEIVERVRRIRDEFPNLELINLGNRDEVRNKMNEISGIDIPDKDVWGDRSTPKNKFRYTKNALALFDFIEASDSSYLTPVRLVPGQDARVLHFLDASNPSKAPVTDFYGEWYWGHATTDK
ncbi:DEAD/DEAH box helicase family protein [Chloroflexota bacterium]